MALNAIINNTERLEAREQKYNFRCSVMLKSDKRAHTLAILNWPLKIEELCRVNKMPKRGEKEEEQKIFVFSRKAKILCNAR